MPDSYLDFRDRPGVFASLEETKFDLLVIGGGITGAGVARDAAMRGLRVALVEANDFGSGTSSRSSKLVHGGMRYVSQGQLTVVREAARERATLRRIAPHLALTTIMILPAGSRAALLALRGAMFTYEKLGRVVEAERHEVWDWDRLKAEEPHYCVEGIVGAVAYPEYNTEDARLTLANVRSARAAGAAVASYATAKEFLLQDGKVAGALVSDTLAGGSQGARIRARVVVNAAGPWVDAVRKLEDPGAPDKLQLSKGIHIVIKRERVPISHTVIMGARDKRGLFVVPRGEYVYFGTTDTFYAQPEYWPEITREDVDYILETGSMTFDTGPFADKDIVSMWSGVRPLLAQKGKSPSEISRRHEVMKGPTGLLSIAGGKLTSYRSMAERVVDLCEESLGRKPSAVRTSEEPLPGGDFSGGVESIRDGLTHGGQSEIEAYRAAQLYGSEAPDVFSKEKGIEAEAECAVTKEGALTLEDYWVRRSARARFDEEGGMACLEPAASRMAKLLNWTDAEKKKHIKDCKAKRAREMRVVT